CVVDAQIARDAARSAGKPGEPHALGERGRNLSGHDEAVLRACVLVVDRFQGRDLALDSLKVRGQGFARDARQVLRDTARYDRVHQVAVAEELRVGPQQVFFQPPELEKAERKRDVVAEIAQVAEVIGNTLELEQDAAQRKRPGRRLGPGGAFDCHCVRPSVGDRGVAGDSARELRALFERHLLEALLDAFVRVAEPLLQPQDLFADDREAEVPRLDRAGVDRTDRDLVHAFALDQDERIALRALSVAGRARGLVAAPQRDQTRLARPGLLAYAAQLARRDRDAERRHRARERCGVESQLFECFAHDQPISAAAWRYQPTR